jgi:ankyrin repeat protein
MLTDSRLQLRRLPAALALGTSEFPLDKNLLPFAMQVDAASFRARGNAAFTRGEIDLALSFYAGALEGGPKEERYMVLANRSHAYLRSKLPTLALADAQASVRLRPDWGKGYSRVAAALLALDRPEDATISLTAGLAALAAALPPEPGAVESLTQQLAEAQAASADAAAQADRFNCHACSAIVAGSSAFRCSKCLRATYCSGACQAAAWRATHRRACKLQRALPPRPRTPLKAWPPLTMAARSAQGCAQAMLQLMCKHGAPPATLPAAEAKAACLKVLAALLSGKPLEDIERLLTRCLCAEALWPLPTAAALGRLDVVRLLLACGARVNSLATQPGTLLAAQLEGSVGTGSAVHNACLYPDPAILRALLEAGGDPDQPYEPLYLPEGKRMYPSPLTHCNANFGCGDGKDEARLQCAELLLRAGADLEARDASGRTPLRHACVLGDRMLPIILLLLRAGACPDAAAHVGYGPCLESSIRPGNLQLGMLRALLDHGASVAVWAVPTETVLGGQYTEQFSPPLVTLCSLLPSGSAAAQAANTAAISALLGAGMCPSTAVIRGAAANLLMPLMQACLSGTTAAIASLLLAYGAHPDAPMLCTDPADPTCQGSPLTRTIMMKAQSTQKGAPQCAPGIIAALLGAGAAPPSTEHYPVLHLAVAGCSEEEVGALMRVAGEQLQQQAAGLAKARGANLPIIMSAINRGNAAVIRHLLDAGTARHAHRARQMPLLGMLMLSNSVQAGAVELLLAHQDSRQESEALLHSPDWPLLHMAARKGHGAAVMELLAAGMSATVGMSATAGNARGVLPLAELLGAGGKARNRGQPRQEEYKRAVAALKAATGEARGAAAVGNDSEGELEEAEHLKGMGAAEIDKLAKEMGML